MDVDRKSCARKIRDSHLKLSKPRPLRVAALSEKRRCPVEDAKWLAVSGYGELTLRFACYILDTRDGHMYGRIRDAYRTYCLLECLSDIPPSSEPVDREETHKHANEDM